MTCYYVVLFLKLWLFFKKICMTQNAYNCLKPFFKCLFWSQHIKMILLQKYFANSKLSKKILRLIYSLISCLGWVKSWDVFWPNPSLKGWDYATHVNKWSRIIGQIFCMYRKLVLSEIREWAPAYLHTLLALDHFLATPPDLHSTFSII